MPSHSEDAHSAVGQCCTYFSRAVEVYADVFETMEIGWKRSMFGEENCIFPNPVRRSQAHSWYNCKDLAASITSIPKILILLHNSFRRVVLIKDSGNCMEG
ncbi:hypothetical protein AVEN_243720-1 [Araneus ventricosus]|uniref:Uncharacterized protein n=1 Tax=Araneus ventricosus TaxID=182803 RepID=A0A4Y2A5P8_ARAVE|nr:hypothetical protein AVEN_243720-1 [Araneus ventricosus]